MADLERGQRIRELREARHLTQEAISDELGVTLRGYQEWEAGGGIKWDNVKKLAKFHNVEADFVMNGPQSATPDPLRLEVVEDRLERLTEIVEKLASTTAELVVGHAPQETPGKRQAAQRKSGPSRKKPAAG